MNEAGGQRVTLPERGRNQAVRIPREFEPPGEGAVMREDGGRLVIEPAATRSLLAVLTVLEPVEEDFPLIEELAHTPVDL
jgi:antitoxin VapB